MDSTLLLIPCSEDMNREESIALHRPKIPHISNQEKDSETLQFQNTVLRQVIKYQHNIIIAYFRSYLNKRKLDLSMLDEHKQMQVIRDAFLKDSKLKVLFEGIIIGQLSVAEYEVFCSAEAELKKRIRDIIKQRIQDSLEQLL